MIERVKIPNHVRISKGWKIGLRGSRKLIIKVEYEKNTQIMSLVCLETLLRMSDKVKEGLLSDDSETQNLYIEIYKQLTPNINNKD